jgi:outer membrane receptor for ferrienterochelin and colicin
MEQFQDIVALQPGVVGRGNEIHLRGGRSGEIMYMVDGMPVKDILFSGTSALMLTSELISEISIISGSYNAEYGNAQSGVVNIVTKSGTPYYSGMLHFRTDQFYADNSFNEYFAYYQFAGPEPITKYLLEKIGLKLPGRELNFISSANIKQTDTAYPYPDSRFKHFKKHEISFLNGLIKIPYTDRQANDYATTNKMTYIFNPALKVIAGYHTSGYRNYNYDHWWRDRPDSAHVSRNNTLHTTVRLQHQFHPSTFYTVDYGRLERYWHQSVAELTPDKYDGNWYAQDLTGDGIADISMAQLWRDSRTVTHTLRGDLTSQIHRRHQMKTGLEFNFEDIESYDIQYPGYKPDRPLPPGSPFPEHGYYRWQLNNRPFNGAVYVQDKIELEGLTVNFGLRYDYVNPGKEVTDTLFINAWERATLLEYEGQGTRSQLSPRIAFGHPMSSRTVIYFSYGHFNQLPERQYFSVTRMQHEPGSVIPI